MNDFELLCHQLCQRALPLEQLQIELTRIKQAAVTLLLREQQGLAELLVIKRAEHPNDPWSGHLALPGGRADAEDADLLATAIREIYEEVGIALPDRSLFLGRLPTLILGHSRLPQIEITPVIAVTHPEVNLHLSEEVAAAFWMPVSQLKESGLSETYRHSYGEAIVKYPAYPSPEGLIWGITQRILTDFLQLMD